MQKNFKTKYIYMESNKKNKNISKVVYLQERIICINKAADINAQIIVVKP